MEDARDVRRSRHILTCSECYQKSKFVLVLRIAQEAQLSLACAEYVSSWICSK